MTKGKGEDFLLNNGTGAKRNRNTAGPKRPVRPHSPSSQMLYGHGSGAPRRQPQPAAPGRTAPPAPTPGSDINAGKKTVFWIVACAIIGLGIYLVAIVSMSNQKVTKEYVLRGKDVTRAGVPARSARLSPVNVSAADVQKGTVKKELAANTILDNRNMKYTVRIIQAPEANLAALNRLLRNRALKDIMGKHAAFIVHIRNGQVVGCIGKFASPYDPEARLLVKKLSRLTCNRTRPFKSAMVWKFRN